MDMQIDIIKELNLTEEILRDLLDCEVLLIGGGEVVGNCY